MLCYFVYVPTFQLVAFVFIFVVRLSCGIGVVACWQRFPLSTDVRRRVQSNMQHDYGKNILKYLCMCICIYVRYLWPRVRPLHRCTSICVCRGLSPSLPSLARSQCSIFVDNNTAATTSATPSLTHWVCCVMLHVAVHSRSVRRGASAATACWRFYPPHGLLLLCFCYCCLSDHCTWVHYSVCFHFCVSLNFFQYYYYVLLLFWLCFCTRSEAEKTNKNS